LGGAHFQHLGGAPIALKSAFGGCAEGGRGRGWHEVASDQYKHRDVMFHAIVVIGNIPVCGFI